MDCGPLAQRSRIALPSSSYLAPVARQEEIQAEASAPVTLYASPGAEPAPAPTRVISISSLPDLPPSQPASLYNSPSDLVRDFDYNEINFLGDYDIERSPDTDITFAASEVEVVETPASKDYGAPRAEILTSASQAVNDYSVPRAEVISFKDNNNDINEAAASVITTSVVKTKPVTRKPVAILRSENTGVKDGKYSWGYETENGISQDVSGEMKMVNDNPVYVMRGSYSYIGPDAQTYTVDWYADETGYHPSAPHLPRSVEPNHPEVAAAVRSQLEFAAQEEAAAASTNNLVFAAPEESQAQYDDIYAASDDLAGYGESLAGYN